MNAHELLDRMSYEVYEDIFWSYLTGLLNAPNRRGVLRQCVSAVRPTLRDATRLALRPEHSHREHLQCDKVWFLATTPNQYNAILPVLRGIPQSQLIVADDLQAPNSVQLDKRARLRWLVSFATLNACFRAVRSTSLNPFLLRFAMLVGLFEELVWLMRSKSPRAVVVANDHSPLPRAFAMAARTCGIPRIYIPHAQVTQAFPPLNFELSLLTGQVMLDTYRECGEVKGQAVLIGTPKLDQYRSIPSRGNLTTLGICFGHFDSIQHVRSTANRLAEQFPEMKIVLRPHPMAWSVAADLSNQFGVSNSREETAWEFLSQVDAIIACDSSIGLEAAILNRPAVYYRSMSLGKLQYDHYGFVQRQLVFPADSYQALESLIRSFRTQLPEVRERAAAFEYMPAAGELHTATDRAVREINAFLDGRSATI